MLHPTPVRGSVQTVSDGGVRYSSTGLGEAPFSGMSAASQAPYRGADSSIGLESVCNTSLISGVS